MPRFNEDIKLTCNVSSNCCTGSSRIWEKGTSTQILNDGMSILPEKYIEDWDGGTTGFSLIIKKLQLSDIGVDYTCPRQTSVNSGCHMGV